MTAYPYQNTACTDCALHKTCKSVCLVGKLTTSNVMIVGEAPGANEDEQGVPFIGAAGAKLHEYIDQHPALASAYITNAVKCRPPENRTPKRREIVTCQQYLTAEIEFHKPRFVLILGSVALSGVLGEKGITKLRGKPIEKGGIVYLPTFHPSALLYDDSNEELFKLDIEKFAEIVEAGGVRKEKGTNTRFVNDWATLDEMLDDLNGKVGFDLETTSLYPWHGKIVSMGLGTRTTQWVVPWDHEDSFWRYNLDDICARIDRAFKENDVKLITQNGKFDCLFMKVHHDTTWVPWFDIMLAHFLCDENSVHGLDFLAARYFGAPQYDIDLKIKHGLYGIDPDESDEGRMHVEYLGLDVYYTRKLWPVMQKLLDEQPGLTRVFEQIVMPCVALFIEVEFDGVFIDQSKFGEAEAFLRGVIAEAQGELERTLAQCLSPEHRMYWDANMYKVKDAEGKRHKMYGINWGSTDQLGKLLFEHLGIEPLDQTDGGKNSTSESVLNRIDHPLVSSLLKLRGAKQQLSFFIEGWKPYMVRGYLHPSFKIHGTVTGRLSAEHPNLQQVPRDVRIRQLITAPIGWTLLEADLSQIELRIAGELSGDRQLLYAFTHDIDVHWLTALTEISRGMGMADEIIGTACRLLKVNDIEYNAAVEAMLKAGPDACVDIDRSWKETRKKAKAINFGYLFGMWWKKFKIYARDNYGVDIDDIGAQASREAFFELYADLEPWHKKQKRFARQHGYVVSLSGRRRHLPDAKSPVKSFFRDEAERQGINAPVQSFANEINLMSALQLRREFGRDVVRICGTVHDAILVRVKSEYVELVGKRLLEIMRQPDLFETFDIKLTVPIEADLSCGPWGKSVKLSKWLAANENIEQRKSYVPAQKAA